MADINSVQSDLSNGVRAPTENDPASSAAAFSTSSRPIDLISKQQRNDRQISTLQYPADVPKYYLTMDIQAYSRQDLFTVAQTTSLSTIVLPIPLKLVDTQQTKYEQGKFSSPGIGVAVNQAAPNIRNSIAQNQGNLLGQATGVAGDVFNATVNTNTAIGQIAGSLDGTNESVTTGVKAFSGYTPNYFLTVLLDGPQYKTHSLNWQFSPRTPEESETINRIIRVMNNAMAPGTYFGGAVFSFPRVFRIAFHPNPRYLYKFKPAVLTNFTVDYSGGGVPSFYRSDSATTGQNAPVMLTMQATFLELEFWLRSDFGGDDNGAGGTLPDDPTTTAGTGRES